MSKCKYCGNEVLDCEQVCSKCGAPVEQEEEQQQVTPANFSKKANVPGIIGLVLGIIGVILSFFGFGYFFGIPALVLGLVGTAIANKKNLKKGIAIAALVLGAVSLLLSIIFTAACKVVSDSLNEAPYSYSTIEGQKEGSSSTENQMKIESPKEVGFSKTLVDNDSITFAIESIDPNELGFYSVNVLCQNKMSDKNLMFAVENSSVNGCMIDALFASEVKAGKMDHASMRFSNDKIALTGNTNPTNITFTLRVYNADDWMEDKIIEETYTIYPLGESEDREYIRADQSTDKVLFDNDSCKMVIYDIGHDSFLGYTLYAYLENKTANKNLMFSIDNASINGIMLNPIFASSVSAGKKEFSTINWFDTALEENGITDINEVTLYFNVYNADDWMEGKIVEGEFTLRN